VAAHPLATRGNTATISSEHVILQSSFLFFCFYTESLSISSRKLVTCYQSQMRLRCSISTFFWAKFMRHFMQPCYHRHGLAVFWSAVRYRQELVEAAHVNAEAGEGPDL